MIENPHAIPRLKYYTFAGFFVIGIVTVLIGQVLPILSTRLSLNDAQAGTFFLAQLSGSLIGFLLSTRIARRNGFVFATLVGFAFIIVGLPGLNFSEFFLCWISIFVYGIGLGLTLSSINLLTIETTPVSEQASAINLVNFGWGIGAICSQPFVELVSRNGSLVAATVILNVALVVLSVIFFSFHRSLPTRTETSEAAREVPRIWHRPSSWLFLLFAFFVLGIETGLGGWLTSYTVALRRDGQDVINAAVVFFFFMVLGRGLAAIVSRKLSADALISICVAILVSGVGLIVLDPETAIIGAALAGMGTSAIFPTNMVRFTRIFGPEATRSATPMFISSLVGQASLSQLIGVVSTDFGSLRAGLGVVLAAAIAAVILQAAIVLTFRNRSSSVDS